MAVLLVVCFHVFPRQVRGGFVGVDIFFVISGYLITSIILRELSNKTFRLGHFYARRIKRIFPALALVLFASFIAGWFILPPKEFISLGESIAGGAGFSANFVLLGQTGYFDDAADQKPLLHLWSLGIEEQFYLVWPLLLTIAARWRLSAIVILVVLILSFGLNILQIGAHPEATFFLPSTRSWELAVGAILACSAAGIGPQILSGWLKRLEGRLYDFADRAYPLADRDVSRSDIRATAGIILLILALAVTNHNTSFPGWIALLPTVAAALIISAQESHFNQKILSGPGLVFIGLISYPLYLWHWPLLVFSQLFQEGNINSFVRWGVVIASVFLAWCTFILVERPIRYGDAKLTVPGLCVVMVAIGVLGLTTIDSRGFRSRLPEAIRDIPDPTPDLVTDWRLSKCFLNPDQDQTAFGPECNDTSRRPLVLLWGDSHAASLYPGLKGISESVPFGLSQYTESSCAPMLSYVQPNRSYCKAIDDYVFGQIKTSKPEAVILNATWDYDLATFDYTVAQLKDAGVKNIFVVGPLPRWGARGLPNDVLDYYYKDMRHTILPSRTHFRSYGASQDASMRQRALSAGAEYISAWDIFCDADGCLARVGKDERFLSAFDYAHLSVAGSQFFANAISARLSGAINRP